MVNNKIKDILKNNKKNFYKFYDISHIFNNKSDYIFKNSTIYEIKSSIYNLTKKEIEWKYWKDFYLNMKKKETKFEFRDIFDFFNVKILSWSIPDNSINNLEYIYNYWEFIISNERFLFRKKDEKILKVYKIKDLFKTKDEFRDIFENIKDRSKFLNTWIFYGNVKWKIYEKLKDIKIDKILDKFYYCDIFLSKKTLKYIVDLIEDKLIFIIEDIKEKKYVDILKWDKNKDFILSSLNLKENQEFKWEDITRGWRNFNFKFINKNKILNTWLANNSWQMVAPKWYRKIENKALKNRDNQDIQKKISEWDFENISSGKYVKNGSRYY